MAKRKNGLTTKEMIGLMGSHVEVTARLKKVVEGPWKGGTITWESETLKEPRHGWVVGFTYKHEGKIESYYEDGSQSETSF